MAATFEDRVNRIRDHLEAEKYQEACVSALTVAEDSGRRGALFATVRDAINLEWPKQKAAAQAVVDLFDDGNLEAPTLRIAHEIESDLLGVAEAQVKIAEISTAPTQKTVSLAIAAFLAGTVLEDALRRLCDANGLQNEAGRTSLSKLQALLYQPSKGVEMIDVGETKQITAWGETRNNADHGNLDQLTQTDVTILVMGVRAFVDRHLP
jgi:hypothetical protein